MFSFKYSLVAVGTVLLLSACAAGGPGSMQMGSAGNRSVASGAAGGSTTLGANSNLERCASPLGTISLTEDVSSTWYGEYRQHKLPSTIQLMRVFIQQSNCFVVVERSARGMNAMNRERELQNSGEMRAGSNFGKGQMVSSDFAMTPEVTFADRNTQGGAEIADIAGEILSRGKLGKEIGRSRTAVSVANRGLREVAQSTATEASVLLMLVDNRSGVQLAAAEGTATKVDFGGPLFRTVGGLTGMSSYTATPAGKVVVAAFMDAFNNMVITLRDYKPQEVKGGLGKGGQLKVGN